MADRIGVELRIIGSDRRMAPYADRFIENADPMDFLQAISRSQAVVTDSFHGSIFSIHFRRPLLTLQRFRASATNNQNTRVEQLFKNIGIANNFLGEDDLINAPAEIPAEPDWTDVEHRLEKLRRESLDYLKKSLEE